MEEEEKINVVSKFRTDYWIRQFIQYVGGLVLIVIFFCMSFENGQLNTGS